MQWERRLISAFIEDEDSEGKCCPYFYFYYITYIVFLATINNHLLDRLRKASLALADGQIDEPCSEEFLRIMAICHENMKHSSSLELNTLRKVYTDAAILRGLLLSLLSLPMNAIASLDQAIIIAGPYGTGRLELIMDLIHNIQRPFLSNRSLNARVITPGSSPNFAKCTVPCLSTPPSFLDFQLTYSRKPFILRDFASSWPALSSRPWKSHAYLCSVAGPGRVVPVEMGRDYRTDDWQQKIMPWDEFLTSLEFEDHPALENAPNVYYLAQHDLTKQFPKLLDDVIIPDYLYAELGSSDFPGYTPPRNENRMLLNTWLGPKGTLSPAHIVSEISLSSLSYSKVCHRTHTSTFSVRSITSRQLVI